MVGKKESPRPLAGQGSSPIGDTQLLMQKGKRGSGHRRP